MMQDGKALQAGTSHYLGTHFAEAQNIRYQDKDGGQTLAHTTSWGVSTRLIGGVIMTHGDDDGLRTPPAVAPRQIVIVPMLRGKPEDSETLSFCEDLAARLQTQSAFGAGLRVMLDRKDQKPTDKRWDWVRRGAPIICEIGGRDAANGQVTFMRRDSLRTGEGKINSQVLPRDEFVAKAAGMLSEIQASLYADAKTRLESNIRTDLKTLDDLTAYYGAEDDETSFKGWARLRWSRPSGAALDEVGEKLKALKLTIRNAPRDEANDGAAKGKCPFTGAPAIEDILIARAY
jgi:prolyl-tRNA synthetase